MAKYKILTIGLLVANNTVKKFDDIIDEEEIIGIPKKLVEEGFIIELTKEELKVLNKVSDAAAAAAQATKDAEEKALKDAEELKAKEVSDAAAAAAQAAKDAEEKALKDAEELKAKEVSDAAAAAAEAEKNKSLPNPLDKLKK